MSGVSPRKIAPLTEIALLAVGGRLASAHAGTVNVPAEAAAVHMKIAEARLGVSKLPPAISTVPPDEPPAVHFTFKMEIRG